MAGRPQTRERKRIEAERAEQIVKLGLPPALPLPTPRRTEPEPWSERLIEEAVRLGAEGLTEVEISAHWNVSVETLHGWRSSKPEFADALARALTQGQAWWEEKARRAIAMGDNRFAAGAWAQVMRARFAGYGERVEFRHTLDLTQLVQIHITTPTPSPMLVEGAAVRS